MSTFSSGILSVQYFDASGLYFDHIIYFYTTGTGFIYVAISFLCLREEKKKIQMSLKASLRPSVSVVGQWD